MRIVGVMGSGQDPHADRSVPLGRWVAELGAHLLTGGGGGVMASVSRAFYEVSPRRGLVIGILPRGEVGPRPKPGYPNAWVEIAISTHLRLSGAHGSDPMSRNHINVLSSDVIIALPGRHGTASEVELALHYGVPIVAFIGERNEIRGLPSQVAVEPQLRGVATFVSHVLASGA